MTLNPAAEANRGSQAAGENPAGRRPSVADLAAIAVTLLAFTLRAYHVARLGLNGDEALGVALAHRGFSAIVQAGTSGDPHPPLYYTLLMGWIALVGDSELAIRFLGLAAGVLLVPLTCWLGRRLFPGPGPLVAALWLAVHPYQVWYAHEARMYLPAAFLGTLSVALLVTWLRRQAPAALAGYVAATAPALYVHYYSSLLVLFQNLFVLGLWASARRQGNRPDVRLAQWAVGQVALLAIFLPWLVVARDLVRGYNALGWGGPLPALAETLVRFSVGHTWEWPGSVAVGTGFAALAAVGLAVALRGSAARGGDVEAKPAEAPDALRGREGILLLGWALFPAAVGFAASFARPMYAPRYLMVSAGALALALGLGVATLWRRQRLIGALALAGVLAVSGQALWNLYFDPAYARSGYNYLARYLADHGQPGDAVVVAGWTQRDTFWYHYQHRLGGRLPAALLPGSDPLDPAETMADVEKVMAEHKGAWYVETDTGRYDPRHVIERQLATQHYKVLDKWFLVNRLVYYASGPTGADVPRQPVARFGGDVLLAGAWQERATARPGEPALVGLLWETSKRLSGNYKVSLLLEDPAGHVLTAVDREPADGFARTSAWEPDRPVRDRYGLLVPASALPGEYSIVVKLYEPATGQALAAVDVGGKPLPDGAPIGRLVVDGPPAASVGDDRPTTPAEADFGPLRLVGYDAPPDVEFLPGQTVGLRLYWLPTAPAPRASPRLSLVDGGGRAVGSAEAPLGPAWYPPDRWEAGRVLGVYTEFTVPARAPTGRYQLRLALGGPDQPPSGRAASLSWLRVRAPERSFAPPKPEHAASARFGEVARLVGYDGPATGGATLRPGESLRLTLHWQAVGEGDVSYKVFAHLVGPDGKLRGQRDAPPLGSTRPTTGWVRDEYLADAYEVPLATDAPAGTYTLKVGLYEEASGRRLPLAGGGDAFDVLTFQVSGR